MPLGGWDKEASCFSRRSLRGSITATREYLFRRSGEDAFRSRSIEDPPLFAVSDRSFLSSSGSRLTERLLRLRSEAIECEAVGSGSESDGVVSSGYGVVPFRIGFEGLVGPRLMCAPVL